MTDTLYAHINRYISLEAEQYEGISKLFKKVQLKKKENLLEEGRICRSNYFVAEGLLRMFFINEKGVEQTTHFALEGWWLADYASFESQKPATYYIQAVERTTVLGISYTNQEKMLKQYPVMERYFRLVQQRANAAAQFRIRTLYDLSREDLFRMFNEKHPDFVQRVPQYLLASFLGFTPEYLSEIRKKKRS